MIKFDIIAKDIIEKDKFLSLKNDPHHGLTRYDHVLRVAQNTPEFCSSTFKKQPLCPYLLRVLLCQIFLICILYNRV